MHKKGEGGYQYVYPTTTVSFPNLIINFSKFSQCNNHFFMVKLVIPEYPNKYSKRDGEEQRWSQRRLLLYPSTHSYVLPFVKNPFNTFGKKTKLMYKNQLRDIIRRTS